MYSQKQTIQDNQASKPVNDMSASSKNTLFTAILNGDSESAVDLANQALIKGLSPRLLIDDELIPAIQKVGELYEKKIYFLPQLIRGAEAMERAMKVLSPKIEGEENEYKKVLAL